MIEHYYAEVQEKDLGFITCGGKGNTKHMATIVAKVRLNAAFVFDFDVLLFDKTLINDIYKILSGNNDNIFIDLENLLDNEPTVKTAKDKAIKSLCGYSDRKGITSEWGKSNISTFDALIQKLSTQGIFIVPNGSLESWAPDVQQKVRFAELAPNVIKSDLDLENKFKKFAKNVLIHLKILIKKQKNLCVILV